MENKIGTNFECRNKVVKTKVEQCEILKLLRI